MLMTTLALFQYKISADQKRVSCKKEKAFPFFLDLENDVGSPLGIGATVGWIVLVQLAVADGKCSMLIVVVNQHLSKIKISK